MVDFYAWYNVSPDSVRTIYNVLAQRRASLSPDLAALLDADVACSRASHEVCNLDFDPFEATQDPCERYEVGKAVIRGDSVAVDITALCGPHGEPIPVATAIVVREEGVWRFSNFVYGGSSDLRTILMKKPVP